MPATHPQYGGLAIWALSLITRLNKIGGGDDLMDKLYFVPSISVADEVRDKFIKLSKQLDNYIANINFKEWTNTLDDMNETDSVDKKLAVPVLRKVDIEPTEAGKARAEGM